ncbi:hypothetical protein L21SP3_01921 [Sedimentisphaera cyanobacteriorum]|uniref:Uncharacterized protein n=1 Tax=Sedimentisphaera cyanobacteriorum TaxID=1940790 RepID=A0A1Q2HS82_9BACT|nr:hypothetical protein L21SP3_01921 [Sedimentisphaera cyanobacteriorum]
MYLFYHERHETHEGDMVLIYFLSTDGTDFIWIIPRKNDILLELVKISGEWRVASGKWQNHKRKIFSKRMPSGSAVANSAVVLGMLNSADIFKNIKHCDKTIYIKILRGLRALRGFKKNYSQRRNHLSGN